MYKHEFSFFFIHMCIQCLGHFSPFPPPPPLPTPSPFLLPPTPCYPAETILPLSLLLNSGFHAGKVGALILVLCMPLVHFALVTLVLASGELFAQAVLKP
jgi:hypothetical protein